MNCYIVGGSKGGVGKSFVSIGLTDFLTQSKGKEILLIETDTSNADVAKVYQDDPGVEVTPLKLDGSDGWIELVNMLEKSDKDTIINTAARSIDGIEKYSNILTNVLPDLSLNSCSFWVINRQRDSLELLKMYSQNFPGTLHVVRNNYFGGPEKFDLYAVSSLKKELANRGETIDFPDMADRVADEIYSKRLSVVKALEEMPLGNRAELMRWRNVMWTMFDGVLADD